MLTGQDIGKIDMINKPYSANVINSKSLPLIILNTTADMKEVSHKYKL